MQQSTQETKRPLNVELTDNYNLYQIQKKLTISNQT